MARPKNPKLPLNDHVYLPLSSWLFGGLSFMNSFGFYELDVHVPRCMFVGLDTSFEIFEAPDTPLKTLEQSWIDTKEYVRRACELLGRPKPGPSLSTAERDVVLNALGRPPGPAWPLYFFTVGDAAAERIVYIGKTNATTHRFATGHSALTALHRPAYEGERKRLYLATVTMFTDEDRYIPLEWVHPTGLRDRLWSDIEAQLIYTFQPELNTDLKAADQSELPAEVTLHNYAGTSTFDAVTIPPHREVEEWEWLRYTN